MADKSIIQRIIARFDRASHEKAEREVVESMARAGSEGGKKAGQNYLRDLRREFDKRKADLQVALARGTISEKEFRKQTAIATRTFRAGILKLMDEAKAKGAAGEAEYIKLSRALRRVGDEGSRGIGRVNRAMTTLQSIALKVTAILGSLWVVRRVAAFGKAVFDLGSSVLAVGNQFNVVFGDQLGDLLRERTEQLRLMAGLTRKDAEEILAGAGSMAQGFGMAKDASADFAQQILELSADLASFNNVPTAQAAQLVQSALIGNTEAARSLKVAFTALDVTNRALAMTGKTAANQLTQEEKALAALAVMTERAGPMIGDLNRTQNDSDNVAKQLAASYAQVKESLAALLVEGTAGQLGLSMLRDTFRDLDRWVRANAESIQFWAVTVVKSVGNVTRGFGFLFTAVKAVAELFSGVLFGVLAAGARGLSLLAEGAALAASAKARLYGLFDAEAQARAQAEADAIRDQAQALREWAKSAEETARTSLRTGLSPGRRTPQAPPTAAEPGAAPGTGTPPVAGVGAGGGAREAEAENKAIRDRIALLKKAREEQILNADHVEELIQLQMAASAELAQENVALERQIELRQRIRDIESITAGMLPAQLPDPQIALEDTVQAHMEVAEEVRSIWADASDALEEEMIGIGQAAGGLFLAWASGGIKGVAQFAKMKVLENLAWVIENIAKAIGNPFDAPRYVAAAQKHGLAALKWGVIAGGAGAASGSGQGGAGVGRAGPGVSGPTVRQAANAQAATEVHIYIDPNDPDNPVFQRIVGRTIQQVTERYGTMPIIHRRSGN